MSTSEKRIMRAPPTNHPLTMFTTRFARFTGDSSGQSEPLLSSFDEPPTTVSIIAQPVNAAGNNNTVGGVGGRHTSSSSGSSGSRNGSTASAQQVTMAATNGGSGSGSGNSSSGGGAPPPANEHNPITSSVVPGSPLLIHYDEVGCVCVVVKQGVHVCLHVLCAHRF